MKNGSVIPLAESPNLTVIPGRLWFFVL